MQIAASDHCTCIRQTPATGGATQNTATETGRPFNQYLAPLLAEMLYPSTTQSGLPANSLASLLPLMMYSPYLVNGINNRSLSLMPLLWRTGMGYTQPYFGYRGLSHLSPLQPDSRLNLKL